MLPIIAVPSPTLGIVRKQQGTLLKIGGVDDHVHLLAKLSPTIAISDVLHNIKSNSPQWINERCDVSRKFEWQSGYAAFSVSESQMPAVAEYIANQAEHHHKKTFEEELLAILKKHKIEFDMRYVFERRSSHRRHALVNSFCCMDYSYQSVEELWFLCCWF